MPSLNLKRYIFTPKLLPSIITAILLAILVSLGFWQLSRADEKEQLLETLHLNQKNSSLSLSQVTEPVAKFRYYPITMKGQFINKPIFLDNKTNKGRVGYQVLLPLQVKDQQQLVMVNLGWIPLGSSRAQLPNVEPIKGTVQVRGDIYVPLKSAYKLNDKQQVLSGWPKRIQTLDFAQISQLLGEPVYPFVVWLSPKSPFGYVRQWQVINMAPEKHVGYSVQWFSLALALLILFIVVSLKKREVVC